MSVERLSSTLHRVHDFVAAAAASGTPRFKLMVTVCWEANFRLLKIFAASVASRGLIASLSSFSIKPTVAHSSSSNIFNHGG